VSRKEVVFSEQEIKDLILVLSEYVETHYSFPTTKRVAALELKLIRLVKS
jgi:hypothetical protein